MDRLMQAYGCETGELDTGQLDGPADGVSMRGKQVRALENEATFETLVKRSCAQTRHKSTGALHGDSFGLIEHV